MVSILGKTILFVTAHPDDESYLAAGTMLRNYEAGGTSYVACATYGEKGKSHVKKKITALQMKNLRKRELLAVSKFLRVSKLLMSGLPDAEMGNKSNQNAFYIELLEFASELRPDIMISFGKDGISGHIDHISVGAVAKKVAKQLSIAFLTFSAPPEFHKSMETLKKRRKYGKYAKSINHQPHNISLKIDGASKLKALKFHKSQMDPGGPFSSLTPKTAKQFLTREYFAF